VAILRGVQEKAFILRHLQYILLATGITMVGSLVKYSLLLQGHTHKRLATAALVTYFPVFSVKNKYRSIAYTTEEFVRQYGTSTL
jgi:hypothetical protein